MILKGQELNHQGVLLLRNAIVKQAAADYLKHYNTSGNQSSFILTIEKWFRSRQFDALCTGVSGEWFIKNLREMAEQGIRKPMANYLRHGSLEFED